MILDTIVAHKRKELLYEQNQVSLSELKSKLTGAPQTQDFFNAITHPDSINLIAEVKKKSPSKGIIRADFDPIRIADTYKENGAAAVSVLTDKHFFDGNLSYLSSIREAIKLPLLRKDFTIHPYHIFQARVAGADAVLLIVAVLTPDQLKEYIQIASALSLASLVEVHTEEELKIALDADSKIIGINNRDLRTFRTTLDTTFKLLELIPEDKVVVSESGIYTRDDAEALREVGVNAILVGESLMRSQDIGEKVRELIG